MSAVMLTIPKCRRLWAFKLAGAIAVGYSEFK
jgi:hypothetical protein